MVFVRKNGYLQKVHISKNIEERDIMAFFQQIGKRITDVGQGVAQQTKNFTDVARLNAKIAEKKEKMSQLLFEMGHDYYQKHRKDTDCEEQDYVDQINALFCEILKCQDDVEMLKAPNTCKACGARLADGASFCMNCGARLASNEREEENAENEIPVKMCPACGAKVEDENMFCTACGTKLD